jgi:hypothetical protein
VDANKMQWFDTYVERHVQIPRGERRSPKMPEIVSTVAPRSCDQNEIKMGSGYNELWTRYAISMP